MSTHRNTFNIRKIKPECQPIEFQACTATDMKNNAFPDGLFVSNMSCRIFQPRCIVQNKENFVTHLSDFNFYVLLLSVTRVDSAINFPSIPDDELDRRHPIRTDNKNSWRFLFGCVINWRLGHSENNPEPFQRDTLNGVAAFFLTYNLFFSIVNLQKS